MTSQRRSDRSLFTSFLCAVYVALMVGVPLVNALADSPSHARTPTFEQLDRDSDGYLDLHEASRVPGLRQRFAALDSNRDGRVDKVEFARRAP